MIQTTSCTGFPSIDNGLGDFPSCVVGAISSPTEEKSAAGRCSGVFRGIRIVFFGAISMSLCSCAYSPQPGGNTDVTSPRDSHNTKDSHDVTTVTMAPGSTYAPTMMKGVDNENGNDCGRYDPGATRFARREDGALRVAPNCNPNFPGY